MELITELNNQHASLLKSDFIYKLDVVDAELFLGRSKIIFYSVYLHKNINIKMFYIKISKNTSFNSFCCILLKKHKITLWLCRFCQFKKNKFC